jgi:hypothetical protein
MTTAAPSAALATIQPAFTDAERLAHAGFLAGYRGLTREAYALDLRQFTTWCRARSLALFAVRRADIESFARELDSIGWSLPAALDLADGDRGVRERGARAGQRSGEGRGLSGGRQGPRPRHCHPTAVHHRRVL